VEGAHEEGSCDSDQSHASQCAGPCLTRLGNTLPASDVAYSTFLCQPQPRQLDFSLRAFSPFYSMSKADPTGQPPPPSYEDAAAQHSALPARPPPGKLRAPLPLDIPVLNQLRGKRIILASASPRRKQLLAQVDHNSLWIYTQTC
jgi:hypothetical protein